MNTRLQRADALLSDQRARLTAIIDSAAPREVKNLARHYLAKVASWQREPDGMRDLALGALGPNLYGASIDDVCWQAAFAIGSMSSPLFEGGNIDEREMSYVG